MKFYISGKISGNSDFKADFERGEQFIKEKGYTAINPVKIDLPLSYEEFMQVDFKLIDLCDGIYMLKGWQDSKGARAELSYAKALNKQVKYEDMQWSLKKCHKSIDNL
jgi:hypothetical protein